MLLWSTVCTLSTVNTPTTTHKRAPRTCSTYWSRPRMTTRLYTQSWRGQWTPAKPLLQSLHWLSVRQCINYKLANLCYLAISFHQLVYHAHLIRPYGQSHSLRSSTQSFLSVPPHNINIAARFSVVAPRLWNSTNELSDCSIRKIFSTDLRHSFSVCDSDIVSRSSVIWHVINWLIDWLIVVGMW